MKREERQLGYSNLLTCFDNSSCKSAKALLPNSFCRKTKPCFYNGFGQGNKEKG